MSQVSRKSGMFNSKIIIITAFILLFSIALLCQYHQQEVKAQSSSSSVTEPGSGVGVLTCSTGEIHKAAIAFEATSTGPSSSAIGDWDISTHSASGDVFKSGTILGGQIPTSGHFTLTGKETSDDICGSIVPSVSIKIIGQCVSGGSAGGLSTVKFRASNGEKADFPSSPTCYGTTS